MPKRIFIRDGGLTSSVPVPAGYTVLGSDNGTPKKQVQSTISDVVPKFQYEIGEYVPSEGGVIYHRFLTGTTQNYLVVDTEDLDEFIWSNINNLNTNATSLWDGQINTDLILAQLGCNEGAAYECSISIRNGKSDWYLPSIQELNTIWNNMFSISKVLDSIGGTQMSSFNSQKYYWSSTEHISYQSFLFNFWNGILSVENKNLYTYFVRAVRKFTI